MDNNNKQQLQMKKTSSSMPTAYHHHHPPPPLPYHPTAYNGYPMPPYNMQHQHHYQPMIMMMPPIQHHRTPMPPIQHQQQAPTTNPFNVTVIPAKKLTRKRKYCKQEGCKLKQKKGEYCFKHSFMNSLEVVHNGAADLTGILPPTTTTDSTAEITPREVQPTLLHRRISFAVEDSGSCRRVPSATADQICHDHEIPKKQTKTKKIQQMNRSEFISSLQHAAVGDNSIGRRVPPPANTNDQVPIYREAKAKKQTKPKIQQVPRSRSESISSLQHKQQSQEQEMEMLQLLHKQQFETLRLQHLLQQCRDDVVEAATTVQSATFDYDQRTCTVKGGECSRDLPSYSSDANKHSLQQLEAELRLLHQFQQYQIPPVYKNVNSLSEQRKIIPSATRDRRDETVQRADYDQGIEECRDPSPVDPPPIVDLTAEEDTPQVTCHAIRKRKISQSSSDPSTAARPNKMSTSQVACHDTRKRKISQSSSDPSTAARPNKMSLLLQALEEKLE